MDKVTLYFKKIPRNDKGTVHLYTVDYLDMKFTISSHKEYKKIKTFAGFWSDDGKIEYLKDFHHPHWWQLTQLRKGEPTEEEKIKLYLEHICKYVSGLYGCECDCVVEDYLNKLIEEWINE